MLNLLNRFLGSGLNQSKYQQRQILLEYFLSHKEHNWLKDNHNVHQLFQLLPIKLLEEICLNKHVLLVRKHDYTKNNYHQKNMIIISKTYEDLILSQKKSAIAYLAHEIALIVQEMENGEDQMLLMEIEADKFVSDLGLTYELEELLMLYDETLDKRVRLSYLTTHHFSRDN